MPGDSKQRQAGSLPVHIRDVPAQPAAGQLPEGLKPVSAAPDDLESQMRDTDPLFDGPSPPHPHKHFSGRAPWLRAGGYPAAQSFTQPCCLAHVPSAQLPSAYGCLVHRSRCIQRKKPCHELNTSTLPCRRPWRQRWCACCPAWQRQTTDTLQIAYPPCCEVVKLTGLSAQL